MIPDSPSTSKVDDAAPLPREISRALRAIPWVTAVLMLVLGVGLIVLSLFNRTHLAEHDQTVEQTKSL